MDLHYAYHRGGEELYGGLTHTFPRGALTAVTGPSGRGKSTLLYLLGLLLRPVCGSVVLDGKRVDDRHDSVRSRIRATRFGFVFQDSVLDLTRPVVDSVIEPARYAGQTRPQAYPRALELLDLVGVGERAGHRPGQISGGQGQRVAIARALMNDPDIVLADEPTGNLDPDNSGAVLDALADSARSGCTVILATHDPVVIERVDTLLEL